MLLYSQLLSAYISTEEHIPKFLCASPQVCTHILGKQSQAALHPPGVPFEEDLNNKNNVMLLVKHWNNSSITGTLCRSRERSPGSLGGVPRAPAGCINSSSLQRAVLGRARSKRKVKCSKTTCIFRAQSPPEIFRDAELSTSDLQGIIVWKPS